MLTAMTAVSGNTATRLQNMRPLKDYHHHEKQKIRCDKAGLAFTGKQFISKPSWLCFLYVASFGLHILACLNPHPIMIALAL